ncbi:hypothetical protein GCM10023229_27890 [Flavisolibacter ginsenosidimutans]
MVGFTGKDYRIKTVPFKFLQLQIEITMNRALVFLVVGVALGLLLAPEKGIKFRKHLFGKMDDALSDTKEALGNPASTWNAKEAHTAVEAANRVEKAV